LRKLASIVSAGMSRIGRFPELNGRELVVEAFLEAWDSCKNLDRKDIGAVFVGNQSETYEHQIMYGSLVSDWLGLLPKGSMRVEGCAAAGALALFAGVTTIMSGLHDVVLVCGIEKMSLRSTSEITDALMSASDLILEQHNGMTFPSIYAMMARAHMSRYGSSEDDLAAVAVKNHHNAIDNPKAHIRKEISRDDVLNSKLIASPLKLYDCSPVSDGAAVAILCKAELASRFSDSPTFVVGMGNSSDTIGLYERDDISWPGAVAQACASSYRMAGLEPRDISFAEVHDAFTINEILHYEAAGFAKRGKGQELVRSHQTDIDGRIPVNPSGGLKARGHPVGATGLCQIYEIYNQLNGRCGKRQIPDAKYALAINEGGSNAIVTTHIISN
jgi:acetyl-CoA acetyltransferase